MARKNRYKENAAKRESGGFVPLTYVVIRSQVFTKLSPIAVKLLIDLLSQYKGDNNGDFCATWSVMKARGWKSPTTLDKAKKELIIKGWIEVSKVGGRNSPHLYAVTFFSVDDCKGKLDINPTASPKSTWRLNEPSTPLIKSLIR